MVVAAAAGWIGVGIYGVWEMVGQEAGDGWKRPYVLFSASLLLALASTVAATWGSGDSNRRRTFRWAARGVGVVAVVSALVAWALPLWATLLAVSSALLAVAAPPRVRPGVAVLGAAQIAGMAVMIGAMEAEMGRQNSYGDYPAAFGLGTLLIAVGSVVGLSILARDASSTQWEPTATVGRDSPATI